MEEKKKFEALQYSYENAGQFRAIAAILIQKNIGMVILPFPKVMKHILIH